MAVTRRGYIFAAFLSSVLSLLLILVAISSDSWIVSTASQDLLTQDSEIRYGIFRGVFEDYVISTPVISTLYMTCIPDMNACAVSCKTNREARELEVRALADGNGTEPTCTSTTVVDTSIKFDEPPVIPFVFYLFLVLVLFLQLFFALIAAGLTILNATKNPTEPIFGLPGCLWSNALTAALGFTAVMMFGIHWSSSGIQNHLAFSFIAVDMYTPDPALGYSYWLLPPAVICSLINVTLIQLRSFLLERDPPPPTLKVDSQSDGTIFLY